jgi:hypothetical protein
MRISGLLSIFLLLGSVAVAQSTKAETFVDALVAVGPPADQKEKMGLYNDLLGAWDVDVIDYAPDGTSQKSKGEWLFSWVLEGRAIQDVYIVPSRAIRQADKSAKVTRYGTSIRAYDRAAAVWHVTWINPVTGAHNMLVGEKRGDKIYQEGKNPDGSLIRWIFSDITANSFHWRGETSTDGGKTWSLAAEFFGHRKKSISRSKGDHQ